MAEEVFGRGGRTCGRGLAVAMTDYSSTNIALLDLAGDTLSGSFISSGSTKVVLNAPLSGDVVFPSSRMKNDIVLIDRYPGSVLSYVGVKDAEVRAQIPVRTGFNSNPQDYLELDDGRAFVSRFEKNSRAGQEQFDEGDDLLWIDSQKRRIVGRIGLDELRQHDSEHLRPSRLALVQGLLVFTLIGYDARFDDAEWARVVVYDVDAHEVLIVHELDGLKNCGGLAVSPDEEQLALACSGLVDAANQAAPAHSGLVVLALDRKNKSMEEIRRSTAADLGRGPFSFSVSYASNELLLVSTHGALEGEDAGRRDSVLSLELATGDFEVLLESADTAFSLGDVRCMEACDVCFVADAARQQIHRFEVKDGTLHKHTRHKVDSEVRLDPRYLGWF